MQRFREGFSDLPALEGFGRLYREDPEGALRLAEEHAWLMASEIRATGLDLSFAPVVDVGHGNLAIGDRAFSEDPQVVASSRLRARQHGGHGRHAQAFPGHGTVRGHPLRHRGRSAHARRIRAHDLVPFVAGIGPGPMR